MTHLITLIATLAFTSQAFAFLSLMDTGKLVDKDVYRVQGEGQVLLDAPEGFNLNARFATGYDEENEIQFEAGVGSVDYYLGAFWKWIPFPDTLDQPAIGGRVGLVFAEYNDFSTYGITVTPMISKEFDANFGYLTPYGGLELSLLNNVNDSSVAMQAIIGLNWKPNEWDFPGLKKFNFLVEYGIEIDDAFNYFSFGANYQF